jgi:hypothetical protein
MRDVDKQEIWDMSHSTPREALLAGMALSHKCWSIVVDDRAIAMFGVSVRSALDPVGVPWLLATDELEALAFSFLKKSRPVVQEMAVGFSGLENWVSEENKISQKWLLFCGFTLYEPQVVGVEKKLFRRFTR